MAKVRVPRAEYMGRREVWRIRSASRHFKRHTLIWRRPEDGGPICTCEDYESKETELGVGSCYHTRALVAHKLSSDGRRRKSAPRKIRKSSSRRRV